MDSVGDMMDAFDQPDPKQPTQPQQAVGQPQAPAAQPQAGGDAFDQLPAEKTVPPPTNKPTPTPYNWLERLEGSALKHVPFGEDNKVLNWVNEHVAQPPVRMGKEVGNIAVQHGLGAIGEQLHPGEDVPDSAKGNETAYWRMKLEQEHPALAGIASSILDTVGNIAGNPTNWPLMGAGAAKSALARTFAKVFGVQMAKDTLEEASDLWDNWGTMSEEQKYKRVSDLITHAYFSKKALEHGAAPKTEGLEVKPRAERVAGERPVSKTIAGVEAPVTAQHAEAISGTQNAPVEETQRGLHELKEFQRTETAPAATAAMHSVLGQSAEDLIAQHDATVNGEERPEEVAGTNQPSKYESIDDAANALREKARSTTYAKADEISEREQAEHQQRLQSALTAEKEGIDYHNQLVDEHNSQLGEGEEPMEHATFDPSRIQEQFEKERPQTYGELKGALDRANADLQSSDAQVREEAVDARDKAEKALDGWFKQHSDEISPEEYTSAKKLIYAGARFQEVANGLRASIDNNNLTGNKLRSIIAGIDNRMIKRGEAPGAFRRLVGDQVYQNWRDVARLFDPIAGQPPSAMTYGKLAMHYIAHHFFGPLGLVGKVGAHWLMDKVFSAPEWGNWFKDMTEAVREKAANGSDIPMNLLQKFKTMYQNSKIGGEEGAVGANVTPRNVGEPVPPKFGRAGLGGQPDAFEQLKGQEEQPEPQHELTMQPGPAGFPEAKVEPTPAFEPAVDKPESEIGTRNPRAKGASGINNPDEMPNMEAMDKAESSAPGYYDKLVVDSMRGYKGENGLPLEDTGASSKSVVNKVIDHLKDNLIWLHNQTPENIRGISKQWYDTANRMTKTMADKYGISHEKMAAVTAALSPKNGWDNNVGMADRLVDTWKNSREHPWDTAMENSLNRITGNPKLKPAFRATLNSIRGLKYDDLTAKSPEALLAKKGLWIRLYDEAHRSKQTPVYAPDGTIRAHQTLTWGMPDPMAKAIAVLEGPDTTQHINDMMGDKNKIRSFYNNIINPNSPRGHVTIDTHAVNADMLKPMGSEDEEVLHNFGGAPGHAETGLGGTYAVHAEAYRRAAQELGIQPRELQSITWEAIRTLFGESKKTPELKSAVNDIWRKYQGQTGAQAPGGEYETRPVKKSLSLDDVRNEILKAAGGFDRPVWQPEVQNQMATIGQGEHSMTADVQSPETSEDLNAKWKGKPQPLAKRLPSGRVDANSLQDIADHMNVNVTPEEKMHSTAHELAHAIVQHSLGVPTDDLAIGLGNKVVKRGVKVEGGAKSSTTGISGGYVDPGTGWHDQVDKINKGEASPEEKKQFIQNYTTQLMAGRAMEEMLGLPFKDVHQHATADRNMAKSAMKVVGIPSYMHDMLMNSATEQAKGILKDYWSQLQHMTQQSVNHFGGKRIDSATFHKYRQGGVYEK